ncbi:sortase [bacterium]|nr:sortase [bacterium]
MSPEIIHKKINDILAVVVIALGLYLVITPLYPEISYYIYSLSNNPTNEESIPQRVETINNINTVIYDIPNTLVIPKIGVDSEIFESENPAILNQGLWRRPHTSTPPQGSNTVIVAHRFQYTSGPQTFYNLDKLAIGDTIIAYWDKQKIEYSVTDIRIVNPNEVSIETQTKDTILTLYTCTPLWTAQKRLVVTAKPIL